MALFIQSVWLWSYINQTQFEPRVDSLFDRGRIGATFTSVWRQVPGLVSSLIGILLTVRSAELHFLKSITDQEWIHVG